MGAPKLTDNSIVERLEELPTLPTVAQELNRVINDPLSSASDVEKVMSQDQSLTTKVLKLINSAYYAIPGGVSNLSRAIAYLGFDTINQVVLTASIFSALKIDSDPEFDMKGFWQHAIGVGMAAETIGEKINYPTPADLFTCGLIHDMGKIAMIALEPDEFARVHKHANENETTFYEAEEALGTLHHTIIGQKLAEKWKLPKLIQKAILYHHQPDSLKRGGITSELQQVVDVTLLANLLVHALKYGSSGHTKVTNAPKVVFDRLNIPSGQLKPLIKSIKEALSNADAFLKIISEDE